MDIELTNVTYRNLDTGNVAYYDKHEGQWYDRITREKVFSYRVYKYVSLSSKLK